MRCRPSIDHITVEDGCGVEAVDRMRIVRCARCHLAYEDPRPSEAVIDAFYSDSQLWTASTDPDGADRSYVEELESKRPLFEDLARRITRFKRGGRLLDVGCGPGLLESVLPSQRWDVLGVEMAPYIVRVGRSTLGATIMEGRFEHLDLPERSFDVVVMKYVLDHLQEPRGALEKARRVLRSDGLLVIAELINVESFCARFFGEGYRLLHPLHFTYFSPTTIRLHLEHLGFRVAAINYPFFRTPYFNAATVRTFVSRAARRAAYRAFGSSQEVISPAWRGNMMDVFAVPL